jgi:hypothetical protein
MGLNMAKNLPKHLNANQKRSLCFTNRIKSRGASLEELGGVPYNSIPEVVENSDIIFFPVGNQIQNCENLAS